VLNNEVNVKILFLLAFLITAGLHAADVSEVAFTRRDNSFPAQSSGGTVHLESSHSMVSAHLSDGAQKKIELMVLFDPATGYYLWDYVEVVGPADNAFPETFTKWPSEPYSALYASKDGITWFRWNAMILTVRRSTGQARNLIAAYDEVLASLRANWLDHYSLFTRTVEVWKLADMSFSTDSKTLWPIAFAEIKEVTRSGGDWVLTVSGQWKAELTLDENFKPKEPHSFKRLPGAAKE
jgi:hypothetical protein